MRAESERGKKEACWRKCLLFGVFVFLRPRYVIIMAAEVEWAHKAKSRPHITEGVCRERVCIYVVTSKLVFLVCERSPSTCHKQLIQIQIYSQVYTC